MPKPSKRSADLAHELRLAIREVTRRMRAASAPHDVTLSQQSVLARLDELGPSTTADLARAEFVKPQSMGVTLAALEEEGFVARAADPADGRRWNVSLTAKGKATLESGRTSRGEWLTHAIATELDDEERKALARAVPLLRKLLGT